MTVRRTQPRGPAAIFAGPAVIACASLAGLVLGLTGEGWRDAVSWLLLGLAPLAILCFWLRRSR